MNAEIQSHLDRVRDLLTQAFNEIIQIGKLAQQTAYPVMHIPVGTNQRVFNAVAPLIPRIAPGVVAEMARHRSGAYSGGPVEGWGLSAADYDDALRLLRAAGLLG